MATYQKVELPALTGLRFIAAFCILFMHTTVWCSPFRDSNVFHEVASIIGIYGMPLFFVLSGFVIHYNYRIRFETLSYRKALQDFFCARFARLYPLYIFFVLVGSLSDFTINWISDYHQQFFEYLFCAITATQSWVYLIVVNNRIVLDNGFGLGWSVSTEFFFYIIYTMFVFLSIRIKSIALNIIILTVFFTSVFIILIMSFIYVDQLMDIARRHVSNFIDARDNFSESFFRWFFYYSPYVRIAEFGLGCLTAQFFLVLRQRPVGRIERNCGAAALYFALYVLLLYGIGYATSPAPLGGLIKFLSLNFGCALPAAVIIFCVARYDDLPLASLLSTWPMTWLGGISYSIYAVHTWTLRPFIRPAVDFNLIFATEAVLRIMVAIAFTVICASATYRLIEVPCRRYLRRRFMGTPEPNRQLAPV